MEKHKNGDWFRCKKEIIRDKNISQSAKWLYVILSYLNNSFGGEKGCFSRKNADLAEDAGMSEKTMKKAKTELINAGYIKCWTNNFNTSSKEEKTFPGICYYKILR